MEWIRKEQCKLPEIGMPVLLACIVKVPDGEHDFYFERLFIGARRETRWIVYCDEYRTVSYPFNDERLRVVGWKELPEDFEIDDDMKSQFDRAIIG